MCSADWDLYRLIEQVEKNIRILNGGECRSDVLTDIINDLMSKEIKDRIGEEYTVDLRSMQASIQEHHLEILDVGLLIRVSKEIKRKLLNSFRL